MDFKRGTLRHAPHVDSSEPDILELALAHSSEIAQRSRSDPTSFEPRIEGFRGGAQPSSGGSHGGGDLQQCRCRMELALHCTRARAPDFVYRMAMLNHLNLLSV